jgi:acyl-coenzyme A thioesterase PaaI-like protein
MLDELIGRTAIALDIWCMTVKLDVRFLKPVPIGEPLTLKGEITKKSSRLLEGRGELRLSDGTLAAEATGTYLKIPNAQMEQFKTALEWWRVE